MRSSRLDFDAEAITYDEDASSIISQASSTLCRTSVVEPVPWSLVAYTSLVWWASAGEKRSGPNEEEEAELDLLSGQARPRHGQAGRRTGRTHGEMLRGDGVTMRFEARDEADTASLLLDHGFIYASFCARQNESVSQYYGWMLRYRAADLSYAGAINTNPRRGRRPGWATRKKWSSSRRRTPGPRRC